MQGTWTWTWQGVFTSVVATLLIAGGATVLTWVKKKWPQYGDNVRYWLSICATLLLIAYLCFGYMPFVKRPTEINVDNIESAVKEWSEEGGYSIAKIETPDTFFAYSITTVNGNQIQVFRSNKQKTSTLQFITSLNAPTQMQILLGSMTQDQITTLSEELGAELNKQRIGFTVSTGTSQLKSNLGVLTVTLQKGAPIREFNEDTFWHYIDDLNFSANFVMAESDIIVKRLTAGKIITAATKTTTTQ